MPVSPQIMVRQKLFLNAFEVLEFLHTGPIRLMSSLPLFERNQLTRLTSKLRSSSPQNKAPNFAAEVSFLRDVVDVPVLASPTMPFWWAWLERVKIKLEYSTYWPNQEKTWKQL